MCKWCRFDWGTPMLFFHWINGGRKGAYQPMLTVPCMRGSHQSMPKCCTQDQQTEHSLQQGISGTLACKDMSHPFGHRNKTLHRMQMIPSVYGTLHKKASTKGQRPKVNLSNKEECNSEHWRQTSALTPNPITSQFPSLIDWTVVDGLCAAVSESDQGKWNRLIADWL